MISIIMPLYNAERFLIETMNSIQEQTYKEYELICINDCSTDRTVEIVEQAMKKDGRIKLIHNEERSGAAISRNKGIKEAKGEYLAFLDGDDIFDAEMLETAYISARNNDLDIVIYEFLQVPSERIYMKETINRSDKYKKKFCIKPFNIREIEPSDFIQLANGPCNKLYKHRFIKKAKIKFQTLSSSNDVYFVEMAYLLAEKIMFLDDERVMLYVRNHNTPSRISSDRDPMCIYNACQKIIESLTERKLIDRLYPYCYLRIYQMILNEFLAIKSEYKKKEFYKFLHDYGINKLLELLNINYQKMFNNELNILSKFVDLEYETKWFENENIIATILRLNNNKIWDLWKQYKNIAIWGVGLYGQSLLKLITEKNINLYCIIDINSKKIGMKINDYIVKAPDEVKFEDIDLIIVAAKNGFYAIKDRVKQYSLNIIDIKEYL